MTDFATPLDSWTALNVTTSTTAAQIPSHACRLFTVQNTDATNNVFLGDSSLTSAGAAAHTAIKLTPGAVMQFELKNTNVFWIASSAATPVVYVTAYQ